MTEEQLPVTPADIHRDIMYSHSYRVVSSRTQRNTVLGVSIALVLLVVESVIWIFNPFHLLRAGVSSSNSALNTIPAYAPLLLLVTLLTIIVACIMVLIADKPLGLRAYLSAVQKDQERVARGYIPLSADPTIDDKGQDVSLLDLVQQQDSNQLVLGAAGAGKTMLLRAYQYRIGQQRWAVIGKRQKVPIFVPMQNYSLSLLARQVPADELAKHSLLDFLATSDLVGMDHLRSYLRKLTEKGRILFLCDGLNDVDADYQESMSAELARLMSGSQNRVLLTCRDVDYQEQPQLAQLLNENLIEREVIYPLQEKQVRGFVERSIEEQKPDRTGQRRQQPTAGQILEVIKRSRLRYHCTNPMMLAILMEIIDSLGVERGKRMDTRGRLLREFVAQLIQREPRKAKRNVGATAKVTGTAGIDQASEVLLFLGEVACAAQWAHNRYAFQLPVSRRNVGVRVGARQSTSYLELAESLQSWLDEHPARGPFVSSEQDTIDTVHERYSPEKLAQLLEFALGATLIDISPGGVLNFRHELIAEYFVAEYFSLINSKIASPLPLRPELLANVAYWTEPVILWAGLLANPLELTKRFAASISSSNLEALVLCLLCIGVLEVAHPAEPPGQVAIPPEVEETLASVLSDEEAREQLANLFTHCAERGGQEVYQSLLPLLTLEGIEEFLVLLDAAVVPDFLFKYLIEIVDDVAREVQVKRLIRILGRFGGAIVVRAIDLSQAAPQRSNRLRSAAINILGGTYDSRAVQPLIAYLGDSNAFIVERAVNSLIRLGPEQTLPAILQILENRTPTASQIHLAALRILERFLSEPVTAQQLTPSQHQRILEVLLPVLTSNYSPEAQLKAREILARLGHTAGERESGEKTIELLIDNLSSPDETMARNAIQTLKAIGPAATPRLLVQLNHQPAEVVRSGIVEVLGQVGDRRALADLLRLMADPSIMVQRQVAVALQAYAPESIPGLIELVLRSVNDAVANRAEQVLIDIGREVVEPVMQALLPLVPGRTHLLVHVLEQVHDPRSIPALINVLKSAQEDQALALAIVHTLGEFPDARVVLPLLEMLASPHVLLYEGAINALSQLGNVAVEKLIAALDVGQKDAITQRVQRALLGMVDFPGQQLLAALARASNAHAQHIMDVFLLKGADAAPLLVTCLFDPDMRVRSYVRQVVSRMNGQVIVPALLEALNHPETEWRILIAQLLLKHPHEAIPPLVSLLSDHERADVAESILIQFGPEILPMIVPGLDAQSGGAQKRAQYIIVVLVRQKPEILPRVVSLFALALPDRAREGLLNVLTNDLVDISVPALLEGLEDAHLVGDVAEALVRLVRRRDTQSERVLGELISALQVDDRRHGAQIALVELGEYAVHGVGNLITDANKSVALAAQDILCEIGVPAFSFLWAAHSDTSNRARRDAARNIFRNMPTVVIKDELVELLTSSDSDNISMALSLLLERIQEESLQAHTEHEMIPALLDYVQTYSGGAEQASLRILALLLLLGGNIVIEHLVRALYDYPDHSERLIHAFLLMGDEAEKVLQEVLQSASTPPGLRAEAAGVLGMMLEQGDVAVYASTLGEYGLWAGQTANRTSILQPERLMVSLRALGGLLAGGHWDIPRLQELRNTSKEGSAARELYEILLGWRYSPRIVMLENDLIAAREERERVVRELTQELLMKQVHIQELEHDLEEIRSEHEARVEELHSAAQEKQSLRDSLHLATQEKQNLRETLQRTTQERQALSENLQKVTRERNTLQSHNDRWREYSERLEEELNRFRGSKKK